MGVLRIAGFTGAWPARDPRALPDNAAAVAVNIRVDGGAYMRGASGPVLIKTLAGATRSVYRIPLPGDDTLLNSFWMEFADIDTDVQRAPIVNDSYERIYWASPSTGLKYATKANIIAGNPGFLVGTPAPTVAAVIEVIAGTGEIDPETGKNVAPTVTRSYTYTYINEFGEESAPGPFTEGTGFSDQDWLIDTLMLPPPPSERAQYTKIRLYRTVSGLTGDTTFYKVVDLTIGDAAQTEGDGLSMFYMDRLSDSVVSGSTAMESTIWALPPEGMQGLVAMPNGIFVSWKGKDLYFSENYRPHAWPAEYTLTLDSEIVGCGVFGNSLVVGTRGAPYVVSGVKSSTMASTKVDAPLPCMSRRSIVSTPEGVYFSSQNGTVGIGPGNAGVITAELINREQWRTSYDPTTHKSMMVHGVLITIADGIDGFGDAPQDGFKFLPMAPPKMGVVEIDLEFEPLNVGVEAYSGKPWVIAEGELYEWEQPGAERQPFFWRSEQVQYPYPTNFAVCQAYFDDGGTGPDRFLYLRVFVTLRGNDGTTSRVQVYEDDIAQYGSGRELKLPSGFKSDVWEWEFEGLGGVELQSFMAASSVRELRSA